MGGLTITGCAFAAQGADHGSGAGKGWPYEIDGSQSAVFAEGSAKRAAPLACRPREKIDKDALAPRIELGLYMMALPESDFLMVTPPTRPTAMAHHPDPRADQRHAQGWYRRDRPVAVDRYRPAWRRRGKPDRRVVQDRVESSFPRQGRLVRQGPDD